MDWLLSHQSAAQSYAVTGTFVLVALWESVSPRRDSVMSLARRWFSNISLTALGSVLTRVCLPVVAISIAEIAQEQHWGLLNVMAIPFWLGCTAGVLALDLSNYAQHRMFHAVPMLWRVHQIHHSDLDVDCGTAIRHHPIESLLSQVVQLGLVVGLGVSPLAVLVAALLEATASIFNHGNVALNTRVERLLRHVLVTPDMHRIHHSMLHAESNSNYSNLVPWWDMLFSTYRREPSRGHVQMELGIDCARAPGDVTLWRLLTLPFRRTGEPDRLAPHAISSR